MRFRVRLIEDRFHSERYVTMNHRSILCLLLSSILLLIAPSQTFGRPTNLGLGLIIGSPTGLAIQIPTTKASATNGSLYYDLRDPKLTVHADQIFLKPFGRMLSFKLDGYYGLGILLNFDFGEAHQKMLNWSYLLVRGPLGGEWGGRNLKLFTELTPAIKVFPNLDIHVQIALGLRYHF